jgi:hypothetical protein
VRYGSIIAACGMAQGMELMGNVAPFILRGVTLKGIDSVMFAKEKRAAIWQQAVQYLPESRLDSLTTVPATASVPLFKWLNSLRISLADYVQLSLQAGFIQRPAIRHPYHHVKG